MEKIVRSYYPLHEADIRKFVEIMDEWIEEAKTTAQEYTQSAAHKVAMAPVPSC
jgi:possible transcriptional regulator